MRLSRRADYARARRNAVTFILEPEQLALWDERRMIVEISCPGLQRYTGQHLAEPFEP